MLAQVWATEEAARSAMVRSAATAVGVRAAVAWEVEERVVVTVKEMVKAAKGLARWVER